MIDRAQTLATLTWLVESGADEAIAEEPVNRFRPSSAPVPQRSAPAVPPIDHGNSGHREAAATRAVPPSVLRQPAPLAGPKPVKVTAEAVSLSTPAGAARALAAGCATLDELRQALVNFDGCGDLKRSAKNTVFADGTPERGIMLIGEAPGRDEDEQGLPFVGRAGKLLDRMLAAIGLERSKVYITNVLNWRPPQNRDPSPEEAAACLPFLHRHIALVQPRLIVLLGAVSVRHVLGLNEGIMRVRGRWEIYQSPQIEHPVPVMPTLHPAFLLRQPAAKRLAWRDLLTISERIEQLGLA
jgi:uracil-DNA glycosylase family 4